MNEFMNMKQIGKLYGKTSHQVGRELKELGYRSTDGKATKRALSENMAVLQRDAEHPQWVCVMWNKAKVCELLEDFGWKRIADDGAE